MSSYKTFLNGVRAAVKKVECKVDGFIKRATQKYNELAYVPIYETPLEDFYTVALEAVHNDIESGFPALGVGKEYLVTIGDVQYKSVARYVELDGAMFACIGSGMLMPGGDPYRVLTTGGGGLVSVFKTEVGKTMTIQKIGEPVEVGKEWLHDYVDEADSKTANALQELADRVNAFLDSDDETLDELSEIIDYIKNNKNLIDSITNGKVNITDIVDNLTTAAANKPLSANQGVVLKGLIDTLTSTVATNKSAAEKLVTEEASTRKSEDSKLETKISELSKTVDANKTAVDEAISKEGQSRVDNDSVLLNRIISAENATGKAQRTADNAVYAANNAQSTADDAVNAANKAKSNVEGQQRYAEPGAFYYGSSGIRSSAFPDGTYCPDINRVVDEDGEFVSAPVCTFAIFVLNKYRSNEMDNVSYLGFTDGVRYQAYPIYNGTINVPQFGYFTVQKIQTSITVSAYDLSTGVPVLVEPVSDDGTPTTTET